MEIMSYMTKSVFETETNSPLACITRTDWYLSWQMLLPVITKSDQSEHPNLKYSSHLRIDVKPDL